MRKNRSCKPNRVEAFSDGVFTIAATFIILSVSAVRVCLHARVASGACARTYCQRRAHCLAPAAPLSRPLLLARSLPLRLVATHAHTRTRAQVDDDASVSVGALLSSRRTQIFS